MNRERATRRPTWLAAVLLLVGVWASIATSPATTQVSAEGSEVVSAAAPVLRLDWEITGGSRSAYSEVSASWEVESETGVEPVLSVTTGGPVLDAEGRRQDGSTGTFPNSWIDLATSHGVLELTVTNPEATGDVTVEWSMSSINEDDGDEYVVTVDADVVSDPSPHVSVLGSNEYEPVPTVYRVRASAPSSATDGLTVQVTPDRATTVWIVVDGEVVEVVEVADADRQGDPIARVIPWPTDCAEPCVLEAEVVMTNTTGVDLDTGDAEGSVTAVGRVAARSEPVWVTLPEGSLLTPTQHTVTVELAASDDPLANHVSLQAELVEASTDWTCDASASYRDASGDFDEIGFALWSDQVSTEIVRLDPGRQDIDILIGPSERGVPCDVDDDSYAVRIGVVTYGIEPPAAPVLNP